MDKRAPQVDYLPVLAFAFALLAGGVIGGLAAGFMLPHSALFKVCAGLALPGGVAIGLAVSEHVDPITALLQIASILDRRKTLGERSLNIATLEVSVAIGPAALGTVVGFALAPFLHASGLALGLNLGLIGLAYGVAVALVIVFLSK